MLLIFLFAVQVQWGPLKFSTGLFVSFLACGFASTIESVGDYYSTARISGVSNPPTHAVNRGILVEGVTTVMCGSVGVGIALTTYSSTIGFIGLTGVRDACDVHTRTRTYTNYAKCVHPCRACTVTFVYIMIV